MSTAKTGQDRLRAFIEDFHDGRQKSLAEAYGLSPSVVSGWMKDGGEKAIPTHMDKIIDLVRREDQLVKEVAALNAERIVELESGYAIVQFSDADTPGTVLCRGIADLEAAKELVAGLQGARQKQSENLQQGETS